MKDMRFTDAVRRVTQLVPDGTGHMTPVVIFERTKDGPRKGSRFVRPIEKAVHRWARSEQARAAKYLERHERSNAKRRDGWVRDLNINTLKAIEAGAKPLRWSRWLRF